MSKVAHVIKHEIATTIGKPSFWLTTFVLPAVVMVFSFGAQFIGSQALQEEPDVIQEETEPGKVQAIGYVDHSGIIQTLPEDIPEGRILAYETQDAARQALNGGEITEYYLIPEDYVESGKVEVVTEEFSPLGNLNTAQIIERILASNLIQDEQLTRRAVNPLPTLSTTAIQISEETQSPQSEAAQVVVIFGTLFILYFVLTMSSSYMLRSVSKEKENRVVEVLLVSLRPREIMLGKVIGLGIVALLQMGIWLGGSVLIVTRGSGALANVGLTMVDQITLPDGFMIWGFVYMLLGYVLYASLLGAVGALAPNARETGQFTFLAMLPLMVPLFINTALTQSPHGTLATVLSLFPLTAPTTMLPRIATGGVPLWQAIASAAGLAVSAYGLVLLAAQFFRADTLLSSAALDWARMRKEFKRIGGR
jgi:ABC-2 type transport system permease protein